MHYFKNNTIIIVVHEPDLTYNFTVAIDILGFPVGSEVKASASNTGDLGLIPGLGRSPGERKWQPILVFLPGESHGQKNLVGYSPRGRKESDMTERLHFTSLYCCRAHKVIVMKLG